MSDIGNLQLGDIEKKKEALNKTGGINTSKSVFNTKSSDGDSEPISPYMTRVEELGNYGPLMQSRIHTQNSNDIAMKRRQTETMKSGGTAGEAGPVEATEQRNVIKAPSDLREFTGTVMKRVPLPLKRRRPQSISSRVYRTGPEVLTTAAAAFTAAWE